MYENLREINFFIDLFILLRLENDYKNVEEWSISSKMHEFMYIACLCMAV